jgi:acyl-CoA thioester hydrolase
MKEKILFTHECQMEIPFFDVDMLQIAWHGHYVKYFEMARCSMLEILGYNYLDMKNDGYAWPIVDMRLKYMNSARFGQKIIIKCDLVEYECRLKINYTIYDCIKRD